MKRFDVSRWFITIFSLLLMAGMSACATNQKGIQIDPTLHSISKDDYLTGNREIELPQNYSTKNYKKLVLTAWFYPNKDAHNYQNTSAETLSTMMETEISKLKRFTVVSRHLGQKGKMTEKKFQDMGTTNRKNRMRFGKGLNAEYSLTRGVSATKEEFDRGAKNEIIYSIRVDYHLIDLETDEIIESDKAEGRAKRTIFRLPSGKIIGGFSQKEEDNAYAEASINALKVIANKIGNKLPIGGQVMGFKGQRFSIDKGYAEGFMGEQTVTLYASDMGIDIPFAVGEAHPGDHKTSGKIIRWSKDPDAKDIIKALQNNPNYIKGNDIFAVSNGMPIPPEWEKSYRN